MVVIGEQGGKVGHLSIKMGRQHQKEADRIDRRRTKILELIKPKVNAVETVCRIDSW
jgi:hypothetical protein